MTLDSLDIKNCRALRDVEIPFSRFGCLTGEHNAGKSSFPAAKKDPNLFPQFNAAAAKAQSFPETGAKKPEFEVILGSIFETAEECRR